MKHITATFFFLLLVTKMSNFATEAELNVPIFHRVLSLKRSQHVRERGIEFQKPDTNMTRIDRKLADKDHYHVKFL